MAVFQERTNKDGVTSSYWRLALANINIQEKGQIKVLWYGYKDADYRARGAGSIDNVWEEHTLTDEQLALLYELLQPISPNFAGSLKLQGELNEQPSA